MEFILCSKFQPRSKTVASKHTVAEAAPGGPEAAQKVGSLSVLIAVDDVQALTSERGSQLTYRCFACACFTHKQRRLGVLQAPAEQCVHPAHGGRPYNTLQSTPEGCCGVRAIGGC